MLPNLCTSVQSVGVFVGGYGIPAIPTPPSEFLPQNPLQVCLRKSSHRIHNTQKLLAENSLPRISQIFTEVGGYGIPAIPTQPSKFLPQNPFQVCLHKSSHRIHRIHRSFRRRIFSHGFHRIHRSFWRRISSHGFHRCTQKLLA